MVINHLGKHFVTSDTATMLREMEVAHPCGNGVEHSSVSVPISPPIWPECERAIFADNKACETLSLRWPVFRAWLRATMSGKSSLPRKCSVTFEVSYDRTPNFRQNGHPPAHYLM